MEERQFGPVRFIPGENRGRYPHCNSVYIPGARVLIDPASDRERLKRLREEDGVDMVWLTHWHEDHFMHLDLFDDRPLWIGAEDQSPLADLESFMDGYGVEDPDHRELFAAWVVSQFNFKPRTATRLLAGDEIIELGSTTVHAVATPGHTPGHLAFFFPESSLVFAGDYDLTAFGPWYGDRRSSLEQTLDSIRKLRSLPAETYLAAHEEGVFEHPSAEVFRRYEQVIYRREDKLLSALAVPRTREELAEEWIVYGKPREPRMFYQFGERAHIAKHLARLERQGRVCRDGDRYCRV